MSGELVTVWTVRVALLLYAAALALGLTGKRRYHARWAWTLGLAFFLAHVAAAFHFFHGWSHEAACQETARQTEAFFGLRSGAGLYLNYAFTLVWGADAAWWWLAEDRYLARPKWVAAAIHVFMGFMVFNATVVFEAGAVRWCAVAAAIGLILLYRRPRVR